MMIPMRIVSILNSIAERRNSRFCSKLEFIDGAGVEFLFPAMELNIETTRIRLTKKNRFY